MSIKAFPLNQQEYSYNAQDVMKYYAGRNSGVFETGENLKVSANGGLEIRVNSGVGWLAKDYVASVAFWNESVDYLMVDAGHDTYDRVDLVVVSWNFVQQEQNPRLIVRNGTPASSPTVPALVNNSSTIEIALARINVGKGSIELHDSDIVDLRGNDTYCPMVYDEQTIREAFRKCVGYADGVNKISDFPSVTPAPSDKILIEQEGKGKSASIQNLILNTVYPIGSIYLSLQDISPSSFIGGSSWEKLPEGKALWTASSGLSITDDGVNTIDAGLPNIKAKLEKSYDFGGNYNTATQYAGTGAISVYRDIQGYGTTNNSEITFEIYRGFNFDANNGATKSGIYRDDCTTVQPPAYKVYAWKRIA